MSSNCGTTLETTAPHLNNKCCNHCKLTCVVIMPCTVHALSCMQHSPVVATAKQSNNALGVGTLPLECVKRSKLVLLSTFCHSCSTDTQNTSSYILCPNLAFDTPSSTVVQLSTACVATGYEPRRQRDHISICRRYHIITDACGAHWHSCVCICLP